MFKSRLKIVIMVLLNTTLATAQNQDFDMRFNVRPLSPEVASLGKFVMTPVNHFTGVPDISIPLYTVKGKSLTSPIVLRYHAGGIKVEEMASMTGLGWSLQSSGMISRQVRGIGDDTPSAGYLYSAYKPSNFDDDIGTNNSILKMNDALSYQLDLEPDIFMFSFQGYSGEFFFDEAGNYHFKSKQDLRIEIVRSSANSIITGWIITIPDGTKFYFGKSKDGTRTANESQITKIHSTVRTDTPPSSITTWHLMDIVDVNQVDEINYTYQGYITSTCAYSSELKIWNMSGVAGNCAPSYRPLTFVETIGTHFLIESIQSANERVQFVKNVDRLDYVGSKQLNEILVYNRINTLIKKIDFDYTYFTSSGGALANTGCNITADEQTKRLKLNWVRESDGAGNYLNPHRFFYNSTNLPARFSKSIDYWGYYNGKANSTLIPSIEYYGSINILFEGADRIPDENYGKACILNKIVYPTGGYTEFEFEQNSAIKLASYKLPKPLSEPRALAVVDNNNTIEQGTLVINNAGAQNAWVNFGFLEHPNCDPIDRDCELYFTIQGVTNSFYQLYRTLSGEVLLENGTYTVRVVKRTSDFNYSLLRFWWREALPENQSDILAGGYRVSKIITRSGTNLPIERNYKYNLFSDINKTSGILTASPIMGWTENMIECGSCNYFVRASISSYPLSTTKGGYVGYTNVEEINGKNGENGYTRYTFTFDFDDDNQAINFPFPPANTFDVLRGNLKERKDFTASNNLISRNKNYYKSLMGASDLFNVRSKGFKVVKTTNGACFSLYTTTGIWHYMESSVSESRDLNGLRIIDSTVFNYTKPTSYVKSNEQISYTSEGKAIRTLSRYAGDPNNEFTYSFSSPADQAKTEMLTKFMIHVPLEQISFTDNQPRAKVRWDYVLNGAHILPKYIYDSKNGTDYALQTTLDFFDQFGNPREVATTTEPLKSYVWSEDGLNVLASVINAGRSQIFYEGFETSGTSGSAKTGYKYFSGTSYEVPVEKRPAGANLMMTYWYLQNNQWNFQSEIPYNYFIQKSGAIGYDEIRIYPNDAQMTTYAYDNNGQLLSVSDPNNQVIKYEYDTFLRLKRVIDDKGNVIKDMTYNYVSGN